MFEETDPDWLAHLGCRGEGSSLLEQEGGDVVVPLPGCQVEGGVARGSGRVGGCPPLQELLHDVHLPQTTGDVQGGLVILVIQEGREIMSR